MNTEKGGYREGAGRKPGSLNKRTLAVEQKIKELGCPFEGMARIADKAEKEGDLATAGRMYAELASYQAPKRKAIDPAERAQPGLGLRLDQIQRLRERILAGDEEIHAVLSEDAGEDNLRCMQ